jgi:hypothetical protein
MKLDQGRIRKQRRLNEGGIVEWTIALYVGQWTLGPSSCARRKQSK